MNSSRIISVIITVLTSWQVIAAVVAVIFCYMLISYVAKVHEHIKMPKIHRAKAAPAAAKPAGDSAQPAESDDLEDTSNADLGLEEE
jgi:hypothetical protein